MLGILVSLKKEIAPYIRNLERVQRKTHGKYTLYTGSHTGVNVKVVVTGIGRGGEYSHINDCSALLSTGVCGALREDMGTGDLVLATEVAFAGVKQIEGIINHKKKAGSGVWVPERTGIFNAAQDNAVRDLLMQYLKGKEIDVHTGRTVTCGRVIRNREEKTIIGSYFDAVAVDMEDYFRFRMAQKLRIPMWSIRAVLDELDDNVPSFKRGVNRPAAADMLYKTPATLSSISRMLEYLIPHITKIFDIV